MTKAGERVLYTIENCTLSTLHKRCYMALIMNPYSERTPDFQYHNLLETVLQNGIRSPAPQGVDTFSVVGPPSLRFDLNVNGFPVITERKIGFWQQPIGEICAFINGVDTIAGLEEFGCSYWKAWANSPYAREMGLAPGEVGPGSYGPAFHAFPTADGGTFDQFKHLVEQIRELPYLKTHVVTPWIPQYTVR